MSSITIKAEFDPTDLLQKVWALDPRCRAAAISALTEWGAETLAISVEQCPVDTGALRSTAHMEIDAATSKLELTMGYGGPATSYAIYVHEILDAHHNPPTKAKYLEDPAIAGATRLNQLLVKRMQEALGNAAITPPLGTFKATAAATVAVARQNAQRHVKYRATHPKKPKH